MTAFTDKRIIKLAIVDDHNLFRKGLIKLINLGDKDRKYTVLFEAENGNELKEMLDKRLLPDIILIDIDMPDVDGFESVSWLKKYYPDIRILVVSMFESEEPILRMIQLKVNGYLSKDIEVEDMHKALEDIMQKGFYYSDTVTDVMANTLQAGRNTLSSSIDVDNRAKYWNSLTENERRFLTLACTEKTYNEIAEEMNLSPKTVDGYRESLFQRFGVKSRVSLAMFAVKNGLVKL
jgi:DNA-binding NarL/FixJ family response regulator